MFYTIMTSLVSLTLIYILINMVKMENTINELSRMIYSLTKKLKSYDETLDDTRNEIVALTTSIDELVVVKSTKKVYPTPDVSSMIAETIKEHIAIELSLSAGLQLPNKNSTDKIIKNTIATYPNIDEVFITKKCLAMIQNTIRQ